MKLLYGVYISLIRTKSSAGVRVKKIQAVCEVGFSRFFSVLVKP